MNKEEVSFDKENFIMKKIFLHLFVVLLYITTMLLQVTVYIPCTCYILPGGDSKIVVGSGYSNINQLEPKTVTSKESFDGTYRIWHTVDQKQLNTNLTFTTVIFLLAYFIPFYIKIIKGDSKTNNIEQEIK